MGCVSCVALMKEPADERDGAALQPQEAEAVPADADKDARADRCSGDTASDVSPAGDSQS